MLPHKLSAVIVMATFAVMFLHIARPQIDPRWKRVGLLAFTVFVACQVTIDEVMDRLDIHRESQIDVVLAGLPENPDIVIVGSSFSSRGIDGARIQEATGDSVAQLTYPGVFAFEQDVALEEYVDRTTPALVLIELGSEFLGSPTDPYAAGHILQFDLARAWWSIRIILEREDMPLSDRIASAWSRVRSMLANETHTGVVRHANRVAVRRQSGYIPLNERVPEVSDEMIAAGLRSTEAMHKEIDAARAFRTWQRQRLLDGGVREVRFFTPPIADPVRRDQIAALCAQLAPCISVDQKLLRSIRPQFWRDMGHLNEAGAEIFTAWLAQQINAVQ